MNIQEIEKLIGYTFNDKQIIKRALTHSSFKRRGANYERLEFFGDSFLNFVIAKYLFQNRRELSVGDMTKLRAQIVCTENLKNATHRMGLWKFVQMVDNGNIAMENKKIFADIFESIAGGIYVDGGEKASEEFILRALEKEITQTINSEKLIDYKTMLQEYIQGGKRGEISYETTSVSGKDHKPSFEIVLKIAGKEISRGVGESKKKASQICAKIALEKFGVLK